MKYAFDPQQEARYQATYTGSPLDQYAKTGIITMEAIAEATEELEQVEQDNPDSYDCDSLHRLVDYMTSHA